MAASLFALLDDIASLMDDVAALSKVAAQKTAGVAGDDLAVGANQMQGLPPHRELPVIWRITKGSLLNKLWLLIALLAIAYFLPALITVLLILGAAYLAFEGAEKIIEKFFPHAHDHEDSPPQTEEDKIRGALRTDLVLSTELMVIAMGAAGDSSLGTKAGVLFAVGIGVTFVIYGIVALIIRLDDMGFALMQRNSATAQQFGRVLVNSAPKILRVLAVVGTVAMFLVAGGIVVHDIPAIHHAVEPVIHLLGSTLTEALVGLVFGLILVSLTTAFNMIKRCFI